MRCKFAAQLIGPGEASLLNSMAERIGGGNSEPILRKRGSEKPWVEGTNRKLVWAVYSENSEFCYG